MGIQGIFGGAEMTEDEARIKYWEAVSLLQEWINNGPNSKEEVLEELEDDLL